jgi:copper chaperone CopZ
MKNIYLFAFLALFIFTYGCNKSESDKTMSKNENTERQNIKEETKQTDNKQTDNQQTNIKENTKMNNSGEYKTVEIKTKGMFCSHCENTVKTSISKLNGIKEVIADAKTNIAKVTYDEGKTNVKEIENAITDAGYGVVEQVQ